MGMLDMGEPISLEERVRQEAEKRLLVALTPV
jgi:hypothetical protein